MPKMKLGDVAIEFKDKCNGNGAGLPSVGLEHLVPGEVRLSNWEDNAQNTFTKLFKKGHILFGRRRAYQKKASVAEFEGKCSGDITVIEAKEGVINKDLLPFIIQNDEFFDFAVSKSAGSLSPRVKWSHLKEYEFSLPDREEQDKLAELLWAIEENIEAYNNLILATDDLIKAKFVEDFGQNMIKKNKWKVTPISHLINSPLTGEWGKEDTDNTGVHIVRTTNFTDTGKVDLTDIVTRQVDERKIEKKKLKTGDIIIEKSGGSGSKPVGRVVLWDKDMLALTNNFTAIIRVKDEKEINPIYLFRFLFDRYWMDETKRYENKTTGIHNLRLDEYLDNTKIPIVPIDLQNKFADFVNVAEKSKDETNEAILRLQLTKKAIIKKYFG